MITQLGTWFCRMETAQSVLLMLELEFREVIRLFEWASTAFDRSGFES